MAAAETSGTSQPGAPGRWSLHCKTALVTGGTRGIGRAVVEELAALGASVHTCSRKEAELGERLKEWGARGFRVTTSVCDLSVREQRERLIGEVAELFGGKLNILGGNKSAEYVVMDCSFSKQVWKKVAAWSNLEQLTQTDTTQVRLDDWWNSGPKFIRIDIIS